MNEQENYKWRVFVRCFTYNHAPFIVDALNGFTMQETNFPFVCAIVDDASTDGEQEVIKQYLNDYFDLEDKKVARHEETDHYVLTFGQHKTNLNCYFAVYLMKYNHYSENKSKMPYLSEWMGIRYFTMCEGDDYWINSHKLQKQYDELESKQYVDMCAHNAYIYNGKKYIGKLGACDKDCILKPEEVIEGGGAFLSTNSLFYRSSLIISPTEMYHAFPYDYALQISGALRGGIIFLSDYMSVYRSFSNPLSWTSAMKERQEKRLSHRKDTFNALELLDKETNGQYSESIDLQIKKIQYLTSLEQFDVGEIFSKDNRSFYRELPLRKRIEVQLYSIFPWVVLFVRKLLNKECPNK